jgi:hypothetical protein
VGDIADNLWKYGFCILGIIISVLLPPLWAFVKSKFQPPPQAGTKGFGAAVMTIWTLFLPYLGLGLASTLTSIILIAVVGDKITSAAGAVLAGYAWDSTLQKLR